MGLQHSGRLCVGYFALSLELFHFGVDLREGGLAYRGLVWLGAWAWLWVGWPAQSERTVDMMRVNIERENDI